MAPPTDSTRTSKVDTHSNEHKMKNRNLALSAMFLALAFIIPLATGQVPQINSVLCPMHIPIFLCGYFCSKEYGFLVGAAAPILRSVIFGVPLMFPTAIAMAFELAAYGFFSGLLFELLPKKNINIYTSFIVAKIIGRAMWGIAHFCLLGFDASKYNLTSFRATGIVSALPGTAIQLLLIPAIIIIVKNKNLLRPKS